MKCEEINGVKRLVQGTKKKKTTTEGSDVMNMQ